MHLWIDFLFRTCIRCGFMCKQYFWLCDFGFYFKRNTFQTEGENSKSISTAIVHKITFFSLFFVLLNSHLECFLSFLYFYTNKSFATNKFKNIKLFVLSLFVRVCLRHINTFKIFFIENFTIFFIKTLNKYY
jgi:hypothetical protein